MSSHADVPSDTAAAVASPLPQPRSADSASPRARREAYDADAAPGAGVGVVPSFPLGRTLAGIVFCAFVVPLALMVLTYGVVHVQLSSLSQAASSSSYTPASPPAARLQLTLASFNVRFDGHASPSPTRRIVSKLMLSDAPAAARALEDEAQPEDGRQWGELSWSTRRHAAADMALFHNWDLFGLQEMLPNQLRDVVSLLGAQPCGLPPGQPALPPLPPAQTYGYDWAGVPRNDGREAGEAVPLFWKRDLFERVPLAQGGTGENGVGHFWLSPSGTPGSVGWDADQTRMCTHVALRLRQRPRQILHAINCHYDHKGLTARAESSKIVLRKAREAVQWSREMQGASGEEPLVIVLGDFNSPRTEAGWQNLVAGHHNVSSLADDEGFTFLDAALAVPLRFANRQQPHFSSAAQREALQPQSPDAVLHARGHLSQPYGPERTFVDFHPLAEPAEQARIDFLLLSDSGAVRSAASLAPRPGAPRDAWTIQTAGIVPAWSSADAGWQISDHHAVQVRIQRGLA